MKLKEEKSDLLSMDDKQIMKQRVIRLKGKHCALMGAIYFSILGIGGVGLAKLHNLVDEINHNLEEIHSGLEDILD